MKRGKHAAFGGVLCGIALALAQMSTPTMAQTFPSALVQTSYEALDGWEQDNHGAAMQAFLQTCRRAVEHTPRSRPSGVDGQALADICASLLEKPDPDPRAFFEQHFTPFTVQSDGRLTGYFEPQVRASFTRTGAFQHPLYALPPDLMELPDEAQALGISDDVTWGRQTDTGFEAFPDRGAIMAGALDAQGLELVYLESAVDAFFIHIQGSARLAMTDGTVQRVNFAGKSGHRYTPIGRTLIERGDMVLDAITMDSLRGWLADANAEDRDIVLASNRSFIFFAMEEDFDPHAGPVAAAGVPLTPGRSLAVDRHLHTFGTPVFVQSVEALPGDDVPFSRLMIAQDTGSAIVGPARGDIFIGSGDAAGQIAGVVNQPVAYTLLMPRAAKP